MSLLPWHRVYRPCGGCGELVSSETGCKHWRPVQAQEIAARKRAQREKLNEGRRNQRAEHREMVDEFRSMLGRNR